MDQRESLEGNLKTHGELNKLHIELNKYKNIKCQNLGDTATSVLREKLMLNVHIIKEEMSYFNNLISLFKMLEK